MKLKLTQKESLPLEEFLREPSALASEGREQLTLETLLNEVILRGEHQNITLRWILSWTVVAYYGVLLISTIALFYLLGLGVISLSENVMLSLSGVLVGSTAAGALMLRVVRSIFPDE